MALLDDERTTIEDERHAPPAAERPERRSEQVPREDKKQDKPGLRERGRSAVTGMRAHPFITAVAAIAAIAVVAAALIWWLIARQYEWTDDAYIDSRTVQVSAQVAGAIVEVPVTDNQLVEAGAPLVRIDSRDYRAALEQAQAAIANFEAQIAAQQSNIEQAQKQAAQAQAALQFAQQENQRSPASRSPG